MFRSGSSPFLAMRVDRRRRLGLLGPLVLALCLWSTAFAGGVWSEKERDVSRRAKKKDQTQAYNEVASIEVSEKAKEHLAVNSQQCYKL